MARVVLVWLLGLWMSTAIGRRVDDRKQIESNRMVDEFMYARNVDAKAGGEPEIEMTTVLCAFLFFIKRFKKSSKFNPHRWKPKKEPLF